MAHTKVTKTHSQNTGTANTFSYSGSFDVFKATEVKVELDNIALTYTASTINDSALSPREYSVDTSAKTIHIGGPNLTSGTIVIKPVTDMGAPTPRATYTPGASITSEDLNNNQTQLLRRAMEYEEQVLFKTGGTMTGVINIGPGSAVQFEGDTSDGNDTNLTAEDPTGTNNIVLPNRSGTIITDGDTGTVTATMLAANSVDSSELVDGSIDTSHIGNSQVTTDKIAADAITGAKIADDAINSEHYTDGSIDTAHIADAQVTTAKIADANVTTAKITDGNVTTAKIATDAITAAKIADGNVGTAALAANAVTQAKMADDSVGSNELLDNSITAAKIVNDTITQAKMADDSVATGNIAANAVTNAKIANNAVDTNHIIDANVTTAKIADANITTAKITDANVTTAKIANDAITIGKIGCEQTTISDSDSHIPTSGAVVDYVAAQIAPIGGLEVIADEDNFPSTQPASGVVISISDAGGVVVNGSGVSTTARTAGNGSDNVTINNFPSDLQSTTLAAGVGLMVTSTGSSNTYNYHKALLKEADLKNLSNDIDDFGNRYRVHNGEPSSNNDDGDLIWDTNANKMKVYDSTASAWQEITSTGDFKFLVPVDAGTTTAATWDGSDTSFDLKETTNSGSAASVTNINQLIVSLNGVIQKPNTGSYSASEEGFYLTDSDTIRFCTAPPSGSSAFIIQCGAAVSIPTPGDGTVTEAKIASAAVTQAKISKPIDLDDNEKVRFGTGDDLEIFHDGSHSNITNSGTGRLYLNAVQINLHNQAANENMLKAVENAQVELSYDGTKKFETTSAGANISGRALIGTTTLAPYSSRILTVGDTTTDDTALEIRSSDDTTGRLYFTDSTSSGEGAYQGELKFNHTDNSFYLQINNETSLKAVKDGAVELYHNGNKKFETTSAGVTITGSQNKIVGDLRFDNSTDADKDIYWDESEDRLNWFDSVKATFGNSNDLEIYHDGSHSFIKNSTGHLKIGDQNVRIMNQACDEDMIHGVQDGTVELYYDGSKKLETTDTGIKIDGGHHEILGDVFFNNADHAGKDIKWDQSEKYLRFDDGVHAHFGTGSDMELYHDGTDSIIKNNTGDLSIRSNSNLKLEAEDGGEDYIHCIKDGAVELHYDGSKKIQTVSTGITVTGQIHAGDATGDLINESALSASVSGNVACFKASGASGHTPLLCWNNHGSGTRTQIEFGDGSSYTARGSVTTDGSNASFNTSSDYRLKQDDVLITDGITIVKALKPKRFKWKDNLSLGVCDGFFAHEVQEAAATSKAASGTKDAVDDDGKPIYQQIDHSKLIPLLTAALKEAITKIETLETKVAALEAG